MLQSETVKSRFNYEGDDVIRTFISEADLRLTSEEYAARNAHYWGLFSYHHCRFRDPDLGRWVRRFAEIFESRELLNHVRKSYLTDDEIRQIQIEEAEGL